MTLLHNLCVTILLTVTLIQCYTVDDSRGVGPPFDGIGGLSAGASSRLLPCYDKSIANEILDILFKPKFAASLQILKVEIGGDGQSTDGTESSHMHNEQDENYQSGYEWWLMTEANKRNPDIKLYGLPWTFPGWLGNGTSSPYKFPELTAGYIVKWIYGAKTVYNLNIDYVGIWNERSFDSTYIKTLRRALDTAGLTYVQIVAADGSFNSIANAVLEDKELADAISILGAHYPGTVSPTNAKMTGKPLWSSEDYSTYNDDIGAGCWARILNQNYVNGNMTSTITWNIIASYYEGLPYFRTGLMTAVEPWSGNYDINGPIYVTAHTTQFTKPGDVYLLNGYGSGLLQYGGSYVSIMDPQTKDLTIIIETMSHDHSKCIRPSLPEYDVSSQQVTFNFKGSFVYITELSRWDSQLFDPETNTSEYFINNGTVKVVDNVLTLDIPADHIITLSTKKGQTKGMYNPPPSKSFPIPYHDDFESYNEFSEANYFSDQSGIFEIRKSQYIQGKVMTQVVSRHVISWCNDANQAVTLIGQSSWQSVIVSVDVVLPNSHNVGAFLGARINNGGCSGTAKATGVFLWINTTGHWSVTKDIAGSMVVHSGDIDVSSGITYTLSMAVNEEFVSIAINDKVSTKLQISDGQGFVGFGTSGYFQVEFDNFNLTKAKLTELD